MTEPVFLGLDEVLEIHNDQIKRYGGDTGIRDIDLLKSAIAMPAAGFGGDYFHTDIYEMAAACLFYIIRNHPFIDGNGRTGKIIYNWINSSLYDPILPEGWEQWGFAIP